jgi:hypothetical protein
MIDLPVRHVDLAEDDNTVHDPDASKVIARRLPAEPDPGPGWLRSRFWRMPNSHRAPYKITPNPVTPLPWPREGHRSACGRNGCPVCDDKAEMPL